jgi:hypothetical protein
MLVRRELKGSAEEEALFNVSFVQRGTRALNTRESGTRFRPNIVKIPPAKNQENG